MGPKETDDDPLLVDDETGELLQGIRAVSRALDRYRWAIGNQMGLGGAEIAALALLLFDDAVSAGEIRERTGLSRGSVTALLDRLDERGYIIRGRPRHNRRVVMVAPTVEGRRAGAAIFRPMVPLLRAATEKPDVPDPAVLHRSLMLVAHILESAATELPDVADEPAD